MRARPIFEEVSLFVTRRVRGRQFLLRPSKKTNQAIAYVVAVLAKRYQIEIHAICAMSNHWHIVSHDLAGNICRFTRDAHSLIARYLNATHGDFEALWSSEQTSHVHCIEPADVIAKMAYTMANPVAAGLVCYGHSWPGIRRDWPAKPLEVKRPPGFFREASKGGHWAESATLEMARPKGFAELSDNQLATIISKQICENEAKARLEMKHQGRKFMGRRRVLSQSRTASPQSQERRFGLSPRIACKSRWRRITGLVQQKYWHAEYTRCLDRWRNGSRDVIFPHGTYKMRFVHGVPVASIPD